MKHFTDLPEPWRKTVGPKKELKPDRRRKYPDEFIMKVAEYYERGVPRKVIAHKLGLTTYQIVALTRVWGIRYKDRYHKEDRVDISFKLPVKVMEKAKFTARMRNITVTAYIRGLIMRDVDI